MNYQIINFLRTTLLFFVLATAISYSEDANAYSFTLSRSEFSTWNERCKALYISTDVGYQSEFRKDLPASIVSKYRRADRLGEWHYCAGLIYLQRARMIGSPIEKKKVLKKARSEMNFSIKKSAAMPIKNMEMRTELAKVHYHLGEREKAFNYLNSALIKHPNHTSIYIALAELNHLNKTSGKAVKIIEDAPKEILASSAELNYFVALYYYKKNDVERSKRYAVTAYQLGFPLPWLKNKLGI